MHEACEAHNDYVITCVPTAGCCPRTSKGVGCEIVVVHICPGASLTCLQFCLLQASLLKELEVEKADLLQQVQQLQQAHVSTESAVDPAGTSEVQGDADPDVSNAAGAVCGVSNAATSGSQQDSCGHQASQIAPGAVLSVTSQPRSSNVLRNALVWSGGAAGAVVAAAVVAVAHGRSKS